MSHARSAIVMVALGALFLGLFGGSAGAVQPEHDVVVSANPADNTPHALDGRVLAIAEVGNRIVVGGTFTQIRAANNATPINRPYLFSFNPATGAIDNNFTPTLNNTVETLAAAPDGQSVYVGGRFNTVNGQTRRNVVKLNISNGQVVSEFTANTNSRVLDLVVRNDKVYLGGAFSQVNGTPRSVLAAVDATTGAIDGNLDLTFSDPYGGRDGVGVVVIQKLDVSPDGTRLVAIGNYGTVDGQDRDQVALIDLASTPAQLANWHTSRYGQNLCSPSFDTYTRDVEISADGSYMVIVATGAYRAGRLCDTAARWNLDETGSNLQPEWVNYTGGDTLYGVGITGEAIYVGGHQRWHNNPFAGDRAGPGAVPREGIAALDPANGMPLSWDPGRARGVGVFEFISTDDGLYLGSDTDRIGRWEFHARLAMFPTQGGQPIPPAEPGPLPGELFKAQPDSGVRDPAYLYRVNAGGGQVGATDPGPDWSGDTQTQPSPYRNSGSNAASWSGALAGTTNVPSTTPADVFSVERWDPSSNPPMQWDFPVEAGREVEVRLYFASRCSCTNDPGERVFNVSLDGASVLSNYDIVADVGHNVATMKSFTITSDGNVDIDFAHITENPLINAIEIVDPALLGEFEPTVAQLEHHAFDGTDLGPVQTVSSGIDWSLARGAFMLSGQLYTPWADGNLYRRSFNGTSFGAATALDLYGLTNAQFPITSLTGAFYEPVKKRLYYTQQGVSALRYRYFAPESGIVGAETFTASGNIPGLNWSNVRGMHLANNGVLYFGSTDGNLRRVDFQDNAPVPGTIGTVSGPATGDGLDWNTRALFLYSGEDFTGPNTPPTANIVASCTGLTCTFGSTGSNDPDGTITSYEWDFGDGATDSGSSAEHTYASAGTFEVTLTVTDNDGASATATRTVSPAPEPVGPVADFSATCVDLSCDFDGSPSSDEDGSITSYAWAFGDGATGSGETASHTYASAGTHTVALTVTDNDGETDVVSKQITVDEAGDSIAFRDTAADTGNKSNFSVTVPSNVVGGDALLLFASFNVNEVDPEPAGLTGWTKVGTQVAGNLRTTLWSRVAQPDDAGGTVTLSAGRNTKADVALFAYSGTDMTAPIDTFESAAETVYRAEHTTPTVSSTTSGGFVVSYWSERSGATSDWTPPAGIDVRREAFGAGGGHISVLLGDQGPVPAGSYGGLTAVADNTNHNATMWTVVLQPR